MADSSVSVTEGSGKNIDTRTNDAGDHRQVIVVGNPTATDSVAAVQATDPSSNAIGVVVRDPLGTLTYGLMDSSGVRVRNVNDGTLSTVSNVTRVDRVMNVIDGTLSTLASLTTGNLATVTRVDRVMNVVDGTITTVTGITNALPSGTNDLGNIIRVKNLVDGTLTTVTGVDRVRNVVDGTLSLVTTVTGVDRVRNVVDGTLSLVSMTQRVNNVVDGTLSMVQRVNNVVDGTLSTVVRVTNLVNGTVQVQFNSNNPITPNSGIPAVNIYSTTSIFTVAGSTSGGTTSGVTLVSPSANYNFKVFAFSLQTTGIVSEVFRFTNGSGGSPTEFWRGLVTAASTTSAPIGANLAVQPPGFLFATGTSTTLALKTDTGSLVHYSVSYIKESA